MKNKKLIMSIAIIAVFSLLIGSCIGIVSRWIQSKGETDTMTEQQLSQDKPASETEIGEQAESFEANASIVTPAEVPTESQPEVSDMTSEAEVQTMSRETENQADIGAVDYTGVDFVSTDSSMYTYEQMMSDLEEMAQAFPTLLTIRNCGTSLDGRAIPEAVLGNQASNRHLFIQASIHAREYINTLVAMEQIENMLVHHSDGMYVDASYDELLSQTCFHILPMSNPDGVTISQMGIDGIRDEGLKEILRNCYQNDLDNGRTSSDIDSYWRTWKANARGVDLNRNFDAGWDTYEGVSYPSSDHYKGEAPVSEPETRAIVDAVHACGAIITISYHSTGSVIYWDYGSTGDVYDRDAALANMVQVLTGYTAQSSIQSAQDAAGCSDYFVLKEGIPSVTIENGYSSCPIGIEEFPTIWNSNTELLPALAFNYR